jgi:hypothetical protein
VAEIDDNLHTPVAGAEKIARAHGARKTFVNGSYPLAECLLDSDGTCSGTLVRFSCKRGLFSYCTLCEPEEGLN